MSTHPESATGTPSTTENGAGEFIKLIESISERVFEQRYSAKMRELEARLADSNQSLTVAQIHAETGYSTNKLYEEIRRGRLAASRPTKRTIRVRRSALEKWLASAADGDETESS